MISQESTSFTQIRTDLRDYIDARPSEQRWLDMLSSSTGMTVIELLATFGSFLSFKILMAQRELNLLSAQKRSTILGAAEGLGYCVSRGYPAEAIMSIICEESVVFQRFDILGEYDGTYDIVCAEDITIGTSLPTNVRVLIGDRKIESRTLVSAKSAILRFNESHVSDFFRLLLNSVEVPVASSYLDLMTQTFAAFTNPTEGVDVFSLNGQEPKYIVGDTLELEYVEYAALAIVTNDKMILDMHTGVLVSFVPSRAPEDSEHIKIAAPVRHESLGLIKSRDDYPKYLSGFLPLIHDVTSRDVSAAIIELSYIPEDLDLIPADDKTALLAQLELSRPFGIPPPIISDPKIIMLNLDITLTLLDETVAQTVIDADVAEILTEFERKFAVDVSPALIESRIKKLSYVKTARLVYQTMTRAFTVDTVDDLLNVDDNWSQEGLPLRFTSTGVLPDPLQVDTTYFILTGAAILGDTITIAEKYSPTPDAVVTLDIVDEGTGTHTISTYIPDVLDWNEFAVITPVIEIE